MLLPANPSSLARHVLHLPVTRVLLVTAILWLTAFAYSKHRFWRDPHSAFFSSDGVYDLQYSKVRQEQARNYILYASNSTGPLPKSKGTPELCAAFVTVKRESIQYVDEAVASILDGLDEEERRALSLQLLFADTETAVHPSWQKPWLRNAVDGMVGYNVSTETLAKLKEWEEKRNFYYKGVFDYLYALRLCYDTGAANVLMFEDDIMVIDGWVAKVREALRIIESKSQKAGDEFWNWIYLRVFYTETSIMWENTDFAWRNMNFIFILASLAGAGSLLASRKFVPVTRKHLDNFSIAALCLISIPAFMALAYMIGKLSIHPPPTVFALNKHGCCTQGLLFPRSQVPDLMHYLEERGNGQTDQMIEDYADRDGKQRLATAKQLIQHVGLQSSRDNAFVNSQSTWAFWFELNDPKKLRKEKEYIRWKLGTNGKTH